MSNENLTPDANNKNTMLLKGSVKRNSKINILIVLLFVLAGFFVINSYYSKNMGKETIQAPGITNEKELITSQPENTTKKEASDDIENLAFDAGVMTGEIINQTGEIASNFWAGLDNETGINESLSSLGENLSNSLNERLNERRNS